MAHINKENIIFILCLISILAHAINHALNSREHEGRAADTREQIPGCNRSHNETK